MNGCISPSFWTPGREVLGWSFGYGNLTFFGDPPKSSAGVGGAFPMKERLVLRILICSNIVYWVKLYRDLTRPKSSKWLAKSQGNGTPAYYQGNFCEGEIRFHLARNSWSIPESWFSQSLEVLFFLKLWQVVTVLAWWMCVAIFKFSYKQFPMFSNLWHDMMGFGIFLHPFQWILF